VSRTPPPRGKGTAEAERKAAEQKKAEERKASEDKRKEKKEKRKGVADEKRRASVASVTSVVSAPEDLVAPRKSWWGTEEPAKAPQPAVPEPKPQPVQRTRTKTFIDVVPIQCRVCNASVDPKEKNCLGCGEPLPAFWRSRRPPSPSTSPAIRGATNLFS